jgi:hypothetical protein
MEIKVKSWKTTLSGVLGALTVVATAVKLAIDGHLAEVNPVQVLEAVGILAVSFGLMAARDDKVTSESAGAVPPKS